MGLDRIKREKIAQPVKIGSLIVTGTLDAVTTSEIINLFSVVEKITFQSDGTLAGTIEFSLNGTNWDDSTAIGAAGVMVSYNTHNISAVRITRSAGSGKLYLAIK